MKGLNFKIRTYNELDTAKAKAKESNPWIKMIKYNPEGLDKESADFIERLDIFSGELTFRRDQLAEMYESLRTALMSEA